MSEPYDIYIPVAPKDYNKLKFVIRSIQETMSGYEGFYISTPDDKIDKTAFSSMDNIYFFRDKEVLDVDTAKIPYRPGWFYQMLLKMFQDVTKNDYYMTIDADTYLLKPLSLFEDGHPVDLIGWEQNYRPYYEFQERFFNLPRLYNSTFICDMNFFKKSIWVEFLSRYGITKEDFFAMVYSSVSPQCQLCEADLYGQYVYKFHPGMYRYKKMMVMNEGRFCSVPTEFVWSEEEIDRLVNTARQSGMDFVTWHSWTNENLYNWI